MPRTRGHASAVVLLSLGMAVTGPGAAVAAGSPGDRPSNTQDAHGDRGAGRDRPGPEHRATPSPRDARTDPASGSVTSRTAVGSRATGARRTTAAPRANDARRTAAAPRTSPTNEPPRTAPAAPVARPPVVSPARVVATESRGGGAPSTTAVDQATPRTVVGNGRSPGDGPRGVVAVETPASVPPAPTRRTSTPAPAPIATASGALADPSPTARSAPAPASRPHDGALPLLTAPAGGGGGVGPLWGLAGLVLAPLLGVYLGHRQARARNAAAQLVSSSGAC